MLESNPSAQRVAIRQGREQDVSALRLSALLVAQKAINSMNQIGELADLWEQSGLPLAQRLADIFGDSFPESGQSE